MSTILITNPKEDKLKITKLHLCSWELNSTEGIIEIGCEIDKACIKDKSQLILNFYLNWLDNDSKIIDLYENLSDSQNSNFIFNDSISNTTYFDGGNKKTGLVHHFSNKNSLAILPVSLKAENKKIKAVVDLSSYLNKDGGNTNCYIRFKIETKLKNLILKKQGISKASHIYDVKVNESRNVPETMKNEQFCAIEQCFYFNVVPNRYNASLLDKNLKSIRSLEYSSFSNYLKDDRLKDNEFMVVFTKKNNESFVFYNIYDNETIGSDQMAAAFLANLACGILLFIPTLRDYDSPDSSLKNLILSSPVEFKIALLILIATLIYLRKFIIQIVTNIFYPTRWS